MQSLQALPHLQERQQLPPFLNIPAAQALNITLNPNDCYRLGAFPYFCENISGYFIRIKMDKGNQHVWARIVSGITTDRLSSLGLVGTIGGSDSSEPLLFTLASKEQEEDALKALKLAENPDIAAWLDLPQFWRSRLLEEPIYEWREKRFETHLICEHPFAAGINRSTLASELSEGLDAADVDVNAPVPSTFLVSFRQLAKEHAPSQEEVDAYCVQFVPIQEEKKVTSADGTTNAAEETIAAITSQQANPFALAQQSDPLAYVPAGYKRAFMTFPVQSEKEAETERLEARIKDRVSKGKPDRNNSDPSKFTLQPPPGSADTAAPPLPHLNIVTAAGNKWSSYFAKNVANRALNKEDSSKVIAANTRLGNVAGNVVIRNAVLFNLNLSRASQIESARRSVELAHSQSVKAAQKALSRQALSQTNIHADATSVAPTPLLMQATQLGSASQNMVEDGSEHIGLTSPSLSNALGGDDTQYKTPSALDVDKLLHTALGPTASATQISELRDSLLYSSSASPNPLRASSTTATPQSGMMLLLTAEERRALEKDDHQFNAYLNNDARRKDLDVLAAITMRNTKTNVALRLQGYRLMAIRDQEREAHDDTSQRMWVTDAEARKQEADAYAKMKAAEAEKAGDKGGKKDDGKKESKGPRYLTEEEELEMYAAEAKRVNATVAERQGSTLLGTSGSLQRAGSSTGSIGDADDLDDLIQLSRNKSLRAEGSQTSNGTPTIVRVSSILSPKERTAVSQSLGRVPIVAVGAKRDREV